MPQDAVRKGPFEGKPEEQAFYARLLQRAKRERDLAATALAKARAARRRPPRGERAK